MFPLLLFFFFFCSFTDARYDDGRAEAQAQAEAEANTATGRCFIYNFVSFRSGFIMFRFAGCCVVAATAVQMRMNSKTCATFFPCKKATATRTTTAAAGTQLEQSENE